MAIGTERRRVVVTGMGALSPLGLDVESTWAAVAAGTSGIATITRFDPTGYETTFAGEVKGFDAAEVLGRKESRRMDRYTQLAVAASLQAGAQAGILEGQVDPTRVGALVATGIGAIETLEQGFETLLSQGPSRIGPFQMPMMLPNMASGLVAMTVGAKGPVFAIASACASSAHAIGEATRWIREGACDIAYAGGTEAAITRLTVASFNAMGALSTRNDAPERASRPFDLDRDGFVMGEGAAILVLEERDHALARGATILGEIAGYGTTDDANHIVQPAPEGEGQARAIGIALADAGLAPTAIDYVNAHGTSTQLNEKFETQAIKGALGDHAYRIPISSTKSMTGHLLGAAGSMEAMISLCAMRDGIAPPTINYETPDPDCDLDYVPNTARTCTIRHVLSNSMGFGGHNVALVFSAPE